MTSNKPSATSPEMVCINCTHYDTVWFNCEFLGFDGIRESPNMRCNVEVEENGVKRFAFIPKRTAELQADQEMIRRLLGDDVIPR